MAGSAPIRPVQPAIRYRTATCCRQPDAAWLIDTGFGGHEPALRSQIESLIPRTLPLSLLPLRLNEFMSIQNIDPFTLYFNVKECFTGNPDAAFWFDFGAGSDSGQDTLDRLKITTISREETIPIGSSRPAGRRLSGADPPDRDALDLRRGDQDAVYLRHVHPHLARPAGGPLDHRGRRRRPDRLRPCALVPAQHPLLVAGRRRHREIAARHRQDPEQARHRDDRARLRLHPARQEDGREAHRSLSTTCSSRWTRASRRRATSAATRKGNGKVHQGTLNRPNPLPREVAPGVFWLGECLEQRQQGKIYHGCNACFLVVGATASMLVETGHPKDFPIIEGQLNKLLAGKPPLKYLFVTHQETPHCGGLGRVLSRYPEGDPLRRRERLSPGLPAIRAPHALDEGRRRDRPRRPRLPGRRAGGARHAHHLVGLRDARARAVPRRRLRLQPLSRGPSLRPRRRGGGLARPQDTTAVFADLALWWTKWADMRNYCARLDRLMETLGVKTVCPTHGLVITDVARTMPKVKEGLLYGSSVGERGTNDASFGKKRRSGAGRDRRLKLCREKMCWPGSPHPTNTSSSARTGARA